MFRLTIISFGLAIIGFGLHGCPMVAEAFDGSEPVSVSNGDVSLSCPAAGASGTNGNASGTHLLAGTAGAISCTNLIPERASWAANSRLMYAVTGNTITQYAAIKPSGIYGVELPVEAGAGDDRVTIGCAQTATDGTSSQWFHMAYDGFFTCLKATGTAWASGDRLKVTANGILDVAADTEWAVAIALTAGSSASTGQVVWMPQAPVTVTASVNLVAFVAPLENLPSGSTTAYTAIGNQADMATSYEANATSTNWMAGQVEAGLTCECNEAIGSGKSMDVKLCKNNSACSGSDLLSTCSLAAAATSCTDGSFSSSTTSDGDDLFVKYERAGGTGVKCQRPSCRFAYSQTEY